MAKTRTDKSIWIRLSPKERSRLEQAAKDAHIHSLSEFCRSIIFREIDKKFRHVA